MREQEGKGPSLGQEAQARFNDPNGEGTLPPAGETCKPPVRVFVDGAANGLTSGVGYWAHQAGQLLLLESVTLKEALTPIELELLACGLALLALAQCGLQREPIVLYVDNPDVARWLQGRARPKRRMLREFVEHVRELVERFPNLRVRHQPRERNLRAHRLARRGMREEGVGAPWRL